MRSDVARLFLHSWAATEGVCRTGEIHDWIKARNEKLTVEIRRTSLGATDWFYDGLTGQIVNKSRSFFQVAGFRQTNTDGKSIEQPIIIQDEIGYLGILCQKIDGLLHFLMQAKIEPGNVNKVQLSPTIQATTSNFTQKHGGAKPAYLAYFMDATGHMTIVDQIQSEQSSRFLKKRNRNIIVLLDEGTELEENPNHKWMTLGQIKSLMKIDNLVNMDTRTVLSCIPLYGHSAWISANDEALAHSLNHSQPGALSMVYGYLNNYKMFASAKCETVPLFALKDWKMSHDNGVDTFHHKSVWPFRIIFCDISIEGREVRHWSQPLFEALGIARFGLFTSVSEGVRLFLVKAKPEIGCFDKIELGPTIQLEATEAPEPGDCVAELFFERLSAGRGAMHNVMLSEEGGRFYHEQNRNAIIEIEQSELPDLPSGYFWLTYHTLNQMIQYNNCVNIQLRNLLSLLEL